MEQNRGLIQKLFSPKKEIRKEEVAEELLLSHISPSQVEIKPDRININGFLNRILMAVGYPYEVEEGFLNKIISSKGNFDVSLHIRPNSIDEGMIRLEYALKKRATDKYGAAKDGKLTPSLDNEIEDIQRILKDVQAGREKIFDLGLFVNVKETDPEELNLQTRRVESDLNSVRILPKRPTFRMKDGFQSIMPIGVNALKLERLMTSSPLSACMPFTTTFLDIEEGGVMLGVNKSNNVPIIRDIFNLTNPHVLVLAKSGGGKSYATKAELVEESMRGVKVFVIDPENEYVDLTKQIGGSVIEISRKSDTIINIMDLMGQSFEDKQLSLLTAFRIMFGEMSQPQEGVIEKAIRRAYARKGITEDPATWKNEPPVIGDVLKSLYELRSETDKRDDRKVLATYHALIRKVERYVTGVFNFMNKHTNIDLNNSFICFHIRNMPEGVKPVMLYLILEYVYSQMKRDLSRKILVIDEAWLLLKHATAESYIFNIVKRARKFNLSLRILTQQVNDLLQSEAGGAVLENTSCKLLLRQDASTIDTVGATFRLTEEEKRILLSASPGEGIRILDNDRYHVHIVTSPKIHDLITTNPDALRKRELEEEYNEKYSFIPAEQPKVDIKLDLGKGLYKKKELSREEINYLKSHHFIETKQMGFERKGTEWYLVKPEKAPYNIGPDHVFLSRIIEQELKKYTDKIVLSATKEPDIVFENKNGMKIAIEIESGTTLLTKPDKLKAKVAALNEKFGKNWFFVVTKATLQPRYAEFGETLTRTMVPERLQKEFQWAKSTAENL